MFRYAFKKTKVQTVYYAVKDKGRQTHGFCFEIIRTQEDLFSTKNADIPLLEGVDLIVNKK